LNLLANRFLPLPQVIQSRGRTKGPSSGFENGCVVRPVRLFAKRPEVVENKERRSSKEAQESKRARKGLDVFAVHYGAGNSEGRGEEAYVIEYLIQ
jgi:hypothetical protein